MLAFYGSLPYNAALDIAPMPESDQPSAQTSAPMTSLRAHYIKSAGFRVIHVDGAIGGPIPSGRGVHLVFYSERVAIPQIVDYRINPNGSIGAEEMKVGKEGLVRELEVDATMDIETAKAFYLLFKKILATVAPDVAS